MSMFLVEPHVAGLRERARSRRAGARVAAAIAVVLLTTTGATGAAAHSSTPNRAAAAPAANGTMRGIVAAALRPSAGAITTVRAINASNGTAAARGSVDRNGAYRLVALPGVYLVVVEKVSRRARPVTGFGWLVRVRAGQTSVLAPIHPGSATARRTTAAVQSRSAFTPGPSNVAAVVAPGPAAVAIRNFTGSGPYAHYGKGLAGMVLTDLVGGRCYIVINWELWPVLLAEIRLQQSRRFDPSTRVTARLTQPTIFVEGSVSSTVSTISWNIRMREIATGRIIGSARGTTPEANIFRAEQVLAKSLRDQLERELCRTRYTGRFSGRTSETAGGLQTLDYSFAGTITFVSNNAANSRPGFAPYTIEKIDYSSTITLGGMCSGTATESASLGKNDEPYNVLHLASAVTPQKGRLYDVNITVQRPTQSTLTATCSGGTTVDYPWAPLAQIVTAGVPFYTDASALRLHGTHNLPGTPISYTWDLARRG